MSSPGIDQTSDQILLCYMREISDSRPLSSEREAELARRVQKGDIEARNTLVHANLRFVVRIALDYRNRGLSLAELISAGNVGLLTAAERFDWTRGFRFISYGVWWVRQAIHQSLKDQRTVRLPLNRIDLVRRISKSVSNLQQKLLANPEVVDIANDLGLTHEQVERTLFENQSVLPLDEPSDRESGYGLLQSLSDPTQATLDEGLDRKHLREGICDALDTLTKRESEILRLYYGLDGAKEMTLEQIGTKFGLTRERIRQIKERSLLKLRHARRGRCLKPFLETVS